MRSKLTILILIAAVAGVIAGYAAHELAPDVSSAATVASYFAVMADIFLRLIKMIIAPLVFATVVAGIAGTGDARTAAGSARRPWAGSSPRQWCRCCSA